MATEPKIGEVTGAVTSHDTATGASSVTEDPAGNNTQSRYKNHRRTKVKFEGETPEMNGHVFQTFGESQDKRQFTKTMEALRRYVNKYCKHAGDMNPIFELKDPVLVPPIDITPTEAKDPLWMLRWTENTKLFLRKEQSLADNMKIVHAVIWGQCSLSLQAKIKQEKDYIVKDKTNDCAWLLKQIKNAIYKFDAKRDIFYSIVEARATLEFVRQQKETDEEFYDIFRSHVLAFEHFGGSIGIDDGLMEALENKTDSNHPGPIPTDASTTVDDLRAWITKNEAYKKSLRAECRERYLAMLFLKKASRDKYNGLWTSLKNNFSRGTNQYPRTLSEAYSLLCAHTPEHKDSRKPGKKQPGQEVTPQGLSFLQESEIIAGRDGVKLANILCFKCRRKGHYANLCPGAPESDFNALQIQDDGTNDQQNLHFMFTQVRLKRIPDTWVLLDSQSTVSIFKNKHLLQDIRIVPERMTIVINGGALESRMKGDTVNFGTI